VRFDARVIAASSIDLGQLVEQGRFRADLYYRLNVLPIRLPPLRERPEDLEPLCEHLLELIALDNEMQPKEIDREAIDALARLPWKGNVRELRNVLERACSLWDGIRLTLDAFKEVVPGLEAVPALDEGTRLGTRLDAALTTGAAAARADVSDAGVERVGVGLAGFEAVDSESPAATLPERIAALERSAIAQALREAGGNRVKAARKLGIARATLYQKLAAYPDLVVER
jgi:DNA-binding NtrC family response regulator